MLRMIARLGCMLATLGTNFATTHVAYGEIVASGDVSPDVTDPLMSFSRRVYVGEESNGTLLIDGGSELRSDGGSLGRFENSSGNVTISGANTMWDATFVTNPTFHVGVRGNGVLRVEDGAALRTGHARVASEQEGSGSVTIAGHSSIWHNLGIRVGDKSEGELTISGGGRLESDGNSRIGAEEGSAGIVRVIGPESAWNQSEYLVIGTGTLHIADGAIVNNSWSNVAALTGAEANVVVTGMGSQWTMSDSLRLSTGIGNPNGTTSSLSNLNILSGGMVTSAKSASVGTSASSQANVRIEGIGSTWRHDGELLIGDSGTGVVTSAQGASLLARKARLGFTATGNGQATVTGLETAWDIAEELSVGMAGSGRLDIQLGARVASGTGVVATLARGEVSVADEDSRWSIEENLFVGGFDNADGMLTVTNAGMVEIGGELTIGYETGSIGQITISSEGLVEVEGETTIGRGENSMATLTISKDGLFDADSNMTFALAEESRGVLNLEPGGELNLHGHNIQIGDGTPEFNITGGILRNVGIFGTHLHHVGGTLAAGNSPGSMRIQGDFSQGENAILEVELSRLSAEVALAGRDFDFYEVDGDVTLNGQLHVVTLDSYSPQLGDSFEVLQGRTIDASRLRIVGTAPFQSQVVSGTDGTARLVLLFVPEPVTPGLGLLVIVAIYGRRVCTVVVDREPSAA